MPIISALVFTATDTTIVATWTTDVNSDSNLTAGGKPAIDQGFQTNVTSHECIVTGLLPSTVYSCIVTSGGVSSAAQNVTTNPAQARIQVTSLTIGSASGPTTAFGDTAYNFVSNDNNTYVVMDDTGLFSKATTPWANEAIGVMTAAQEATFAGTAVNYLTALGANATFTGSDGEGRAANNITATGVALSYKETGLFGMARNLYIFSCRSDDNGTSQTAYHGTVMKSTDHGVTWNTAQVPSTYNANGVVQSPVTAYSTTPSIYPNPNFGVTTPVRYAPDDGTFGYNTAGNQIDGANGFVYVMLLDTWYCENSSMYLARIPRVQLDAQNGTAFQYWTGPASPTPANFVNDSNWISAPSLCTRTQTKSNVFSAGINSKFATPTGFNTPGLDITNTYLQVTTTTATGSGIIWSGDGAWPSQDQYSEITVHNTTTGDQAQVLVRCAADGSAYYVLEVKGTIGGTVTLEIFRITLSGSGYTALASTTVTLNIGDTVGLAAIGGVNGVGTDLFVYHNGALVTSVSDALNNGGSPLSGYPGLGVYTPSGSATDNQIAAWTAGTATGFVSTLTPIYSAASQVSQPDMVFIPALNSYLLLTWYRPFPGTSSDTVWVISAAPTPAGPWTKVATQTNNPSGYYNPVVMQRSLAANTTQNGVALTLTATGDFNVQADYYVNLFSLTLETSMYNISGNAGVGGATVGATGMGTVSDSFAGISLDSNWTQVSGGGSFSVSSGQVSTQSRQTTYYWNADTFGNDQYAQTVVGTPGTQGMGPCVRIAASGVGYFVLANSTPSIKVYKGNWTTLSFSQIGTTSSAAVNTGDVLNLSVVGNKITLTQNGMPICGSPITDTTYASGQPGIAGYPGGGDTLGSFTAEYSVTTSVIADGLGNYTVPNLINGTYTIIPSFGSDVFTPSNAIETVNNASITGVNFATSPIIPTPSAGQVNVIQFVKQVPQAVIDALSVFKTTNGRTMTFAEFQAECVVLIASSAITSDEYMITADWKNNAAYPTTTGNPQ